MYRSVLVAALVIASVNALVAPHVGHRRSHALLANSISNGPNVLAAVPPAKLKKRCKVQSASSSSAASSSSSVAPAATSSPAVAAPEEAPSSAATSNTPAPAAPAPAPTTTKKTTTEAPAPAPTPSPSQPVQDSGNLPLYLVGTQTGDGTFYGTGLGACGITNQDTDFIVAVSELLFDTFPGYTGTNPNNNPVCGRGITANYNGNSVHVTVTDRCVACSITSLDFSPAAFDVLADPSIGRLHNVEWTWD